jgi:Ser/Thr protein kinase RdoA (MazF antagonist)
MRYFAVVPMEEETGAARTRRGPPHRRPDDPRRGPHRGHRPPALSSDFVHRLLRHLEAAGFDGAPRSLGRDGTGRDVLAWIEGDVPADLSAAHDDAVLAAAARLTRRYHDATAALLAAPAAAAAGLEVVCHNDLSPCNFVFRAGVPVAIIDFDAAVPGTRAHDLGYAAWLWLDLGGPDVEASGQRRRLGVFLDSYGPVPDRAEVVAAILHRQDLLVAQGRRVGDTALQRWAAGCRAWTRDHLGDEAVA